MQQLSELHSKNLTASMHPALAPRQIRCTSSHPTSSFIRWSAVLLFFSSALFGQNATPPPALAAWWPFDGSMQEVLNSTVTSSTTAPAFVPGKVGEAALFAGNAGLFVADRTQFTFGTTSFTINAWVRPDAISANDDGAIVDKRVWVGGTGSTGWIGYILHFVNGDRGAEFAFQIANHQLIQVYSGPVELGRFYAVAGVVDRAAGKISIYVDGQLRHRTSIPLNLNAANSSRLFIGQQCLDAEPTTAVEPFRGSIDELQIYDRALAPEEIAALHQATNVGANCATQVAALSEQIALLTGQLQAANALNATLQQQLSSATASLVSLTAERDSLADRLATAQVQIEVLQAEKTALLKKVQDLQTQLADATEANAVLNAQITELNGRLTTAMRLLAETQAELAQTTAALLQKASELEAERQNVATLTARVGDLTAQRDAKAAELAQANNTITSLGHQLAQANADLARERTLLANALAANQLLAQQEARMSAEFASLTQLLASTFNDPTFAVPGATPVEKLQILVNAIEALNPGQQQALYKKLGGTK